MQGFQLLMAAATGIAVQEVVQWYALRSDLSKEEHRNTLHDRNYWLVVAAMLLFGTLAAYWWMAEDSMRYTTKDALLLGISFPAVVRKAIAAAVPKETRPLGTNWTTYIR